MVKHNYLLLTYDYDLDDISVKKLYCTKRDAKRYLAQEMFNWITDAIDDPLDAEGILDSALIEDGRTPYTEFYGVVQFSDWHVTLEVIRSTLVEKTEIDVGEQNDLEKALSRGDRIDPYEERYNWETGRRIRD